jgi:hypothetical protein
MRAHGKPQVQTVTELKSFRRAAENAGMSSDDIEDLVSHLAVKPDDGEVIEGTGGCRKIRFSIRGNNKGKSGGIRTITLFTGENLPVFLLTVFGKGQKVNLTKAERNDLKKLSDQIVKEYTGVLRLSQLENEHEQKDFQSNS